MLITSCAKIIEGLFKRNGGWQRLQGELAAYYWPRIVGPEIASKTEAEAYRHGYLVVKTENPALAHQLSLMQKEITSRYRNKFGTQVIQGVKVKIAQVTPRQPVEAPLNLPEMSAEEEKLARQYSETISDPELAKHFRHFMGLVYKNNRLKQIQGGQICAACGSVTEAGFQYCPCCERKINEETKAFLTFVKKKKLAETDVQKVVQEAEHLFINKGFEKK